MKRMLIIVLAAATVISCNLNGYTKASYTSISNFEYDATGFVDSLYQTSTCYGGDGSYYLQFNSARQTTGAPATGGFILTMKKDSSLVLKEDNLYPQYTMYATSAASSSKVCAVYYQNENSSLNPEHGIWFYAAANGTCLPTYCVINNTQQTVYNVLSDDSPYKFEQGDWLKLTISGVLDGEKTGSVEYYLADYRGTGEKPDSVLTSWKYISLSKLSSIEYIDFSIESSRDNFPKTVCLDNLIASIDVEFND